VVAPIERRQQGLVPRQCRSVTAAEQVEPIIEPGCNFRNPEHAAACRRQLDRQRNAVEPPADSGHDGRNRPAQ